MRYFDEETGLLPDLSELDRQMRNNANNFHFTEFRLSDAILADMQRLEGNRIAFSCESCIVFKRPENLIETISSVDFLKAVFAVPFCKGFGCYHALLQAEGVKHATLKATNQEDVAKATEYLRDFTPEQLPDEIKLPIENAVREELLRAGAQADKLDENIARFFSFVTQQRGRGKAVGRKDAVTSRILSGLNFIAQSSGVVVHVVEQMAGDEKLYKDSLEILSMQMPVCETGGNYAGSNRIICGAPGTGKSYRLTNEIAKYGLESTRVVFHPEYSYYDFVGSYKPVPVYRQDDSAQQSRQKLVTLSGDDAGVPGVPTIDYEFVAGPFTNILIKALSNPRKSYCLIIEEINRADAAAVFGDIFQLLDRCRDGESAYGIEPSKELANYLIAQNVLKKDERLKIPANLSIWATMNSADQGVTVLDSAFKRRWNLEYLPIKLEQNRQLDSAVITYNNEKHTLLGLLTAINEALRDLSIPEDRLIGQFFISEESLIEYDDIDKAFAKVLIYLWDDVLRNRRDKFFDMTVAPTLAIVLDQYSKKDVLRLELPSSVDNEQNDGDLGVVTDDQGELDDSYGSDFDMSVGYEGQ